MIYAIVKNVVIPALISVINRAPFLSLAYRSLESSANTPTNLTWPHPSNLKIRPNVEVESFESKDLIEFLKETIFPFKETTLYTWTKRGYGTNFIQCLSSSRAIISETKLARFERKERRIDKPSPSAATPLLESKTLQCESLKDLACLNSLQEAADEFSKVIEAWKGPVGSWNRDDAKYRVRPESMGRKFNINTPIGTNWMIGKGV